MGMEFHSVVESRATPGNADATHKMRMRSGSQLLRESERPPQWSGRKPHGFNRFWYARRDSNPEPSVPKTDALSVELRAQETLREIIAVDDDSVRVAAEQFEWKVAGWKDVWQSCVTLGETGLGSGMLSIEHGDF